MAKLSKAAVVLLTEAGCSEVADDYVVLGSTDLRILLSHRAVADLNAQARGEDGGAPETAEPRQALGAAPRPAETSDNPGVDPWLEGIRTRK